MKPSGRSAFYLSAFLLACTLWPCARAESAVLRREEVGALFNMARDSTRADQAVAQCRALLAGTGESKLEVAEAAMVRTGLVTALITLQRPLREVAASGDTMLALVAAETAGSNAVGFATELMRHAQTRTLAPRYARQGLERLPPGPGSAMPRGEAEVILALDCLGRQVADSAVIHLARALPDRADSQAVLSQLGTTCAQLQRESEAIRYWIRAAGVFGQSDTSYMDALRESYARKNGSIAGLEAQIAAARKSSRRKVAIEAPRVDEPAPDWTLKDLAGKSVTLSGLKGQIVLLDFWGSWCGPCRRELPHFEELYGRYRGRKVAFLSINVEMVASEAEHIEKARAFIEQNHFSFPVLPDHGGVAVQAQSIESFPTLLLIDPSGRIRFRNVGYREGFDDVIADQLAEMMK